MTGLPSRGDGHGPCPYELRILELWDAGLSRDAIAKLVPQSPKKIEQALALNEDGSHRKHVATMRAASTRFLAALRAEQEAAA